MTIWHDNTELPKENSACLFVHTFFKHSLLSTGFFIKGSFVNDSDEKVSGIVKWAYSEDILKRALK